MSFRWSSRGARGFALWLRDDRMPILAFNSWDGRWGFNIFGFVYLSPAVVGMAPGRTVKTTE